MLYTYKRPFFGDTFSIFSPAGLIGSLNISAWKQTAVGALNGKMYRFKTSGFFKSVTEVIDTVSGDTVCNISYNTWGSKAVLLLKDGSLYEWHYANGWQTRWVLSGPSVSEIKCKLRTITGEIETEELNELLFLSGMYIANHFSQNTAAIMIAVMIPIIAAASR